MSEKPVNDYKLSTLAKAPILYVVLGMHRSGTSALTRAFEVFGVELGDCLLQPQKDNPKGFFEDREIVEFNDKLLALAGKIWSSTPPLQTEKLMQMCVPSLQAEASILLKSKILSASKYCIKDPRMCLLLPFWQQVFSLNGINPVYIIAFRNPVSVAESLYKRNKLPPIIAYHLYLYHLLLCVKYTDGCERLMVDYDRLMDSTRVELNRLQRFLHGVAEINDDSLNEYTNSFIDLGLRHSCYNINDMDKFPNLPILLIQAMKIFHKVASDELTLEDESVNDIMVKFNDYIINAEPLLDYVNSIPYDLKNEILNRDNHIANIEKMIIDECQISAEKNNTIINLKADLQRKDSFIKDIQDLLDSSINDRKLLEQDISEANSKLEEHSKLFEVSQMKISELESQVIMKNQSVEALRNELMMIKIKEIHDGVWYGAGFTLKNFPSKKLFFRKFIYFFKKSLPIKLVPISEITGDSDGWHSTGNDPQFLIVSCLPWHEISGWYILKLDVFSDMPLNIEIYLDTGHGFHAQQVRSLQVKESGLQEILIFVPKNCRSIRVDPCDTPGPFIMRVVNFVRLNTQETELKSNECQEIINTYGLNIGNLCDLKPENLLSRCNDKNYAWHSEGQDPYFIVRNLQKGFVRGWYKLCFRVTTDVKFNTLKLYVDYGDGFNEFDSFAVQYESCEIAYRICYLKQRPIRLRLDPLQSVAKFTIERADLRPVNLFLAYFTMLMQYSLKNPNCKLNNILFNLIFNNWINASKLYIQYNQSFNIGASGCKISYQEWINFIELPRVSNDIINCNAAAEISYGPLISIIMPTYNTDLKYLRLSIESVIKQSYPNWELCIADDASTDSGVLELLREYSELDNRIKVVYRSINGHISAASNSAIEIATGDYIALLDHDDEISSNALYYITLEINKYPETLIIYTDEDKIDTNGIRTDPHFKSDWNPDLLLSQNYVSHLGVYQLDLVRKIGGFRIGVEGSQDHDLLLRCLPFVNSSQIRHIPKILYHWRILPGSTAKDSNEKSYTTDAGVKAISDHFDGVAQAERVDVRSGKFPNTYRVTYPIPIPQPFVSLIIPTRDMLIYLERCIDSIIEKTTYNNYEIIIIDNGSREKETLEYFDRAESSLPRVRVLKYNHQFNYSAINNFGVNNTNANIIGLVNNDVEVISPDWLTEMVSHASRPEIGCVGAKLYYGDGTVQHAGVILGLGGVAGHSHKYFSGESPGYFLRLQLVQNLSAVTGACMLVRKSIYEEVGGLDEDLEVAFNDVDFCIKVREAGYRNLWTPYAELYHHESKSRGKENTPDKIHRFNSEINYMKCKWGNLLFQDPYYNPNLTLNFEDFSIKG